MVLRCQESVIGRCDVLTTEVTSIKYAVGLWCGPWQVTKVLGLCWPQVGPGAKTLCEVWTPVTQKALGSSWYFLSAKIPKLALKSTRLLLSNAHIWTGFTMWFSKKVIFCIFTTFALVLHPMWVGTTWQLETGTLNHLNNIKRLFQSCWPPEVGRQEKSARKQTEFQNFGLKICKKKKGKEIWWFLGLKSAKSWTGASWGLTQSD